MFLAEELSFLGHNFFVHDQVPSWHEMPPQDELFIADWTDYIYDIPKEGVIEALRPRLVQLNFPIAEGMKSHTEYQMATKQGIMTDAISSRAGTTLEEPTNLKVYLYKTWAGRIPVMETGNRQDFETLVQVFAHRNEPVEIPASMGACLIKGYNNWDRVAKYKQQQAENFNFNYMKNHKELYQDSFLIITDTGYSGVSAPMLGLTEEEWRKLSLVIRREHEATHYFTLRFLGSAKNHLLDEFIADYMGIVAATGTYRADWFLCFMGLENYPDYRTGGRLKNYLKDVELSEEGFTQLKYYMKNAAENMENFGRQNPDIYSLAGRYEVLLKLTKTNIIQLASNDPEKLF